VPRPPLVFFIFVIIAVARAAPRLDRAALVVLDGFFFHLGGTLPRWYLFAALLATLSLRSVGCIAMRATHDRLLKTLRFEKSGFFC
jgi:hypothetical protein